MSSMMQENKKALELISNLAVSPKIYDDTKATLGVDDDDVNAWRTSTAVLAKNPTNEQAIATRNTIYDKVEAAQKPKDPAVFEKSQLYRAAAKNFLDQDINTQANFFRKLGYDIDSTTDGNLYYIDKKTKERVAIDPKSLDLWDITDIITDVAEGVGTSAAVYGGIAAGGALGLKAGAAAGSGLGPLGSLAGGTVGAIGGGIVGGAAAAYGTAATSEAARQFISKLAGARKEFDGDEINRAGLISAAMSPLELFGIGSQKAGKQLLKNEGKALNFPRENQQQIDDAFKLLNIDPLPSASTQYRGANILERDLLESTGTMGGSSLRKKSAENYTKYRQEAADLVKDKTGDSRTQVAEKAQAFLTDSVEKRLQPAIDVYQKYEGLLRNNNAKLQILDEGLDPKSKAAQTPWLVREITGDLAKIRTKVAGDAKTMAVLDNIERTAASTETIDGISDLIRNTIRVELDRAPTDGNLKYLASVMIPTIQKAKDDAIIGLSTKYGTPDAGKAVINELREANRIYREVGTDVDILFKGKKKAKEGLQAKVDRSLIADEKVPVNELNKLFNLKDPTKLEHLKNKFPEAFDAMRTREIADIAEAATKNNVVDPKLLAKAIGKLEPETAVLIFGKDGAEKAKALKTVIDSGLEPMNPSRTEVKRQFSQLFKGIATFGVPWAMDQAASILKDYNLTKLTSAPSNKSNLADFGVKLMKSAPVVRGVANPLIRGNENKKPLLPDERKGLMP